MRNALSLMVLFTLAACGAHTSVQSGYNGDRDECQELSELKLPLFVDESKPLNMKERNAKLVTLFSDCMFERGWTVATPTRAGAASFRADPGVGVGASIRPGRFSDQEQGAANIQRDAQRAFDPSPAAPQNQGVLIESQDALDDAPGIVRKVPTQNPQGF